MIASFLALVSASVCLQQSAKIIAGNNTQRPASVNKDGSVQCPKPQEVDVFLVMGQSQAANMAEKRLEAHAPMSYMFNKGSCWPLKDPIIGATNDRGSIWPVFADYMGGHVVIANLAISGSPISKWTNASQLNIVKSTVKDLQQAGYSKFNVIWVQGEADDSRGTSTAEYYQQLTSLSSALPEVSWLLTQQSHCGFKEAADNPINAAKRMFVASQFKAALGPNLDYLGTEYRMPNDCHFNIKGQILLGKQMAEAVRVTVPTNIVRWPGVTTHIPHRLARR